MSAAPVRVTMAGTTDGVSVHALMNASRIGCYLPFTSSEPVSPVEMAERGLTACRYCWPAGIVWPISPPPMSAPNREATA
jgi:hypothetical protein